MLGCDLLLRHRKAILLLLLFAAICNVVIYLYLMDNKTEPTIQSTMRSTVQQPEITTAAISQLLLPSRLGALGRPARGNWTRQQLLAMEQSERETGYNAWLSDRISPDRTLHDMRHRR